MDTRLRERLHALLDGRAPFRDAALPMAFWHSSGWVWMMQLEAQAAGPDIISTLYTLSLEAVNPWGARRLYHKMVARWTNDRLSYAVCADGVWVSVGGDAWRFQPRAQDEPDGPTEPPADVRACAEEGAWLHAAVRTALEM